MAEAAEACPKCGRAGYLVQTDLKRPLPKPLMREVWRCQDTKGCGYEELRQPKLPIP